MQNAIPDAPPGGSGDDVAVRIAQRTLAGRGADYSTEVRRLLDAGREIMRRSGTASRPRVADIVAEAGLSNDAFYRHFASKDMLVAAILEDGTVRLRSYLEHQMAKERTPEGQVRRWVAGVLGQAADPDVAAATLAVLWNAGTAGTANPSTNGLLASLLEAPFVELGSTAPALDASLAANAVIGVLSDYLWREARPTKVETERITAFCLAAISAG